MDSLSLGKRLRRWLRGASAIDSGEVPQPDYLPAPSPIDWTQAVSAWEQKGISPTELASALLAAARDGDPAQHAVIIDALDSADARWWLVLDEALRQRWWWAPSWSRDIASALANGEPDLLRLVVAACHHNGRIREAAVAHLAGQTHPAAVAVLAMRACDWVAEVRQRARTIVEGWPSLSGPALITLVEMAFALRGRRDGGWLAGHVDTIMNGLPATEMGPLLAARDRRVRRAAYRATIVAGQLSLGQLTTAAVRDADLPIRVMCARAAVQSATDPEQLRGLLASRTALVRAEALHALALAGELSVAEAALTDRHPLVRETAQAALCRAGIDPAMSYRRFAASEIPEPGAIAGLGETGTDADAEIIERCLSHPRARGRAEAIRALRRLGVNRPAAVIPLLCDESGAVTRQVVVTLRRDSGSLDRSVLSSLLAQDNPAHVRFAGYRLLTAGDAWERLATNLRLVDDSDGRLRANARADITTWLQRDAATTYQTPASGRRTELDRLIERARPSLGENKTRLLRFHTGLL